MCSKQAMCISGVLTAAPSSAAPSSCSFSESICSLVCGCLGQVVGAVHYDDDHGKVLDHVRLTQWLDKDAPLSGEHVLLVSAQPPTFFSTLQVACISHSKLEAISCCAWFTMNQQHCDLWSVVASNDCRWTRLMTPGRPWPASLRRCSSTSRRYCL